MKYTVYFVVTLVLFTACKQNATTETATEIPVTTDSTMTVVQTIEQPAEPPKSDLPFIGTRTFCVIKDENQSSGKFKLTILKDGIMSYNFTLKNEGECSGEGCPIEFKEKLIGYQIKCTNKYECPCSYRIKFFDENKFEWCGEEGGFTAQLCE